MTGRSVARPWGMGPPADPPAATGQTLDAGEIDRFARHAREWWDPKGKFRPLHQIAPVRLAFLRAELVRHFARPGDVRRPLDELQIPTDRAYEAEDLLTGERYLWHGARNYVELNPASLPGHILKIHRRMKVETDFEYFL